MLAPCWVVDILDVMANGQSSYDGHRLTAPTSALSSVVQLDRSARAVIALARDASRAVEFRAVLAGCTRLGASWSESLNAVRRFDERIAAVREVTRAAVMPKRFIADMAIASEASMSKLRSSMSIDLSPLVGIGRSVDDLVKVSMRPLKDWWRRLEDCYPPNLRGLATLSEIAEVARDEGIAVCGVPRGEIVQRLLEEPDAPARQQVLLNHREEILEDCRDLLSDLGGELVKQCLDAIYAFADGHFSAAQSHAAGVITSILEVIPARPRRRFAKKPLDSLPITNLRLWLALQPVEHALVSWKPNRGVPPPDQFSRHATGHGVGQTGVFSECRSLGALMLATSLTRQFHEDVRDHWSYS